MLIMHQHPDNKGKVPKVVASHQTVYERTGVDADSRWRVVWDNVGKADLYCDMTCTLPRDACIVVQCEHGDLVIECESRATGDGHDAGRRRAILIPAPPFKPSVFYIVPHPDMKLGKITERTRHEHPIHAGGGMSYEADEVARCIRDGKTESERMPLSESRIVQGWFDEVISKGDTVLKSLTNPVKA